MFELSLEDLQYGIHQKKSPNIVPFKGFSKAISPLFDPSDAVEPFAMEAANLLGESDQYGMYASQGLESLNYEIALVKTIKNKYGIEGLNPNKFATEGIKEVAGKMLKAIVVGFLRLVQAVSNFIKSIMNFIGGAIAKGQSELVKVYQDAQSKKTWKGETKIKSITSKFGDGQLKVLFDQTLKLGTLFEGLQQAGEKIAPYISSMGKAIMSGNGQKARHAGLAALSRARKEGNKLGDKLSEEDDQSDDPPPSGGGTEAPPEITAAKAILDKLKTTFFKNGKPVSPQKAMNSLIWGADGPKKGDTTCQAVIDNIGIGVLTQTSLGSMQSNVKIGKKGIQALTKIYKVADGIQKKAEHFGLPRVLPATLSEARLLGSYATGCLLANFSIFLKARSAAAQAVKAGVKGSKNTEEKDAA